MKTSSLSTAHAFVEEIRPCRKNSSQWRLFSKIIILLFLMSVAKAGFARCTGYDSQSTPQTAGFGTVTVSPSTPAGTLLATTTSSPVFNSNSRYTCNAGDYNFVASQPLFSTLSQYPYQIFQTNIPGIGIQVCIYGGPCPTNRTLPFTLPGQFSGPTQVPGVQNFFFTVNLYKITAGSVGSGSLIQGQLGVVTVDGVQLASLNLGNTVIQAETPTCSLSTASATFNMGTLKTSDFNRGAGATYNWVTNQSLRASGNCNASTASMTFAGTADTAYPNAFKNNGSATGVAMQLWQSNGSQAIPNSQTPIRFAAGANQNFTFSARYIQTAPTVNAGSVNATVTATVNYQ